jgi:hypothetical protein
VWRAPPLDALSGFPQRVAATTSRSDIALKHDIARLGRLDNGLGFYHFSYNDSNKIYVGVVAQEVQNVAPGAVIRGGDGFLRVNYESLGRRFQTYDQWHASGARARGSAAITFGTVKPETAKGATLLQTFPTDAKLVLPRRSQKSGADHQGQVQEVGRSRARPNSRAVGCTGGSFTSP